MQDFQLVCQVTQKEGYKHSSRAGRRQLIVGVQRPFSSLKGMYLFLHIYISLWLPSVVFHA